MATTPSPGQVVGVAGLISAYGEAEAQKAAAINQQTSYLLQARDTLAVAQVRADMSEQYASIQAGRTLKKAELEAQNYTIAGNTLLKNMRATNAAVRARAAASGVVLGEGSIQAIQTQNVAATMRDVGISDLNALTARVMGFEDASAMLESSDIQNLKDFESNKLLKIPEVKKNYETKKDLIDIIDFQDTFGIRCEVYYKKNIWVKTSDAYDKNTLSEANSRLEKEGAELIKL
jgi:hypothetical protein